jgi:hypothetical protein
VPPTQLVRLRSAGSLGIRPQSARVLVGSESLGSALVHPDGNDRVKDLRIEAVQKKEVIRVTVRHVSARPSARSASTAPRLLVPSHPVLRLLSPPPSLPDALKSWHFPKRPHEGAVAKVKSCSVPLFGSCIFTTHILAHSTYLKFHLRSDFSVKVEAWPLEKQSYILLGLGIRLLILTGPLHCFSTPKSTAYSGLNKQRSKCLAKTSKLQLPRLLRQLRSPHDSRMSLMTICHANGINAMSAATLLRLST